MAGKEVMDGRSGYRVVGDGVHHEDMPRDLASSRHEATLASVRGGRVEIQHYDTRRVVETYENGRKVKNASGKSATPRQPADPTPPAKK